MMGRPFGNTSSSIRSALRDRFMLGGLKLGQSLSQPDLLPPKHGQIALVSISRWRVQADNPVKDSGRARTSRMAVDLHGEFMDFGAGSKVRQTAPVGQGSIFIALSSRQIEFASSFHFSLWQTKWQESGRQPGFLAAMHVRRNIDLNAVVGKVPLGGCNVTQHC